MDSVDINKIVEKINGWNLDDYFDIEERKAVIKQLQNTSSNSAYAVQASPSPKSCLSCKYKCTGHTNAMCTENEFCDYEPA